LKKQATAEMTCTKFINHGGNEIRQKFPLVARSGGVIVWRVTDVKQTASDVEKSLNSGVNVKITAHARLPIRQ